MKPALVLFMKEPRPGFVKTRMKLPPERAAELYRAFCLDAWRSCAASGLPAWIAYDSGGPGAQGAPSWVDERAPHFFQKGRSLGERLENAFARMFKEGYAPIALGTDSPGVPPSYLRRAASLLEEKDLVLGPTPDGGYYLIGLARPVPQLLGGVPWSTSEVFAETLRRAKHRGLSVGLLPPFPDIDRISDIRRWQGWKPKAAAPSTRRALRFLLDGRR